MSITLDQAKALRRGDILLDQWGKRWKVNGQVQTWKRDPSRVRVPVKHGLYAYDQVTEHSLEWVTLERDLDADIDAGLDPAEIRAQNVADQR